MRAGPFTRAQAIAAGYSAARIRRLVADSAWVVVRHGVYVPASVLAAAADDPERRARVGGVGVAARDGP